MLQKLNKRNGGFTLVEIMIVVAIIALLAAIAVPSFLRARKRSQATTVKNDLRLIDAALDQYAIESNRASGAITMAGLKPFFKDGTALYNDQDVFKNSYGSQTIGTIPKVQTTTYNNLSDVVDDAFWSPYK